MSTYSGHEVRREGGGLAPGEYWRHTVQLVGEGLVPCPNTGVMKYIEEKGVMRGENRGQAVQLGGECLAQGEYIESS